MRPEVLRRATAKMSIVTHTEDGTPIQELGMDNKSPPEPIRFKVQIWIAKRPTLYM